VATGTGGRAHQGYTRKRSSGSTSPALPPEEIGAGQPERELELASSKGRFEEEGWRIRKDGSRFWASVVLTATRNRDGVLIGFTNITRDLSERKRAAAGNGRACAAAVGGRGAGPYALRTAQLDQVIERSMQTIRERFRSTTSASCAPASRRCQARGPCGSTRRTGRGVRLPRGIRLPPLTANDVRFLQAVANVVAVAMARSQSEEQLRSPNANAVEERGRSVRIQEALLERDEFIAVAAHELRTPLTALQLKLQGLESNGGLPLPRVSGSARRCVRPSGSRGSSIACSTFSGSRRDGGDGARDLRHLAVLVHQVAEDLREPAAQTRAALSCKCRRRSRDRGTGCGSSRCW